MVKTDGLTVFNLTTGEKIGTIEDTKIFLSSDTERLDYFNLALEYYIQHGWFGGFNSDLYYIQLQIK